MGKIFKIFYLWLEDIGGHLLIGGRGPEYLSEIYPLSESISNSLFYELYIKKAILAL